MSMTTKASHAGLSLAAAIILTMDLSGGKASAQTAEKPAIDLPNPYAAGVKFGQLSEGRQWGGGDCRDARSRRQEHLGFRALWWQ
jgi:hypothetical protein